MVVVQVDEEDYLACLEDFNTHLHGQIILSKGDKPLTHLDLTKKLQLVWKAIGPWKTIPLAKGFYEFEFSSLEYMRWALVMGSLQLSLGLLRVFAWTKNFVPTMKSTKTQPGLESTIFLWNIGNQGRYFPSPYFFVLLCL